jgi:predicted PurR-regulated permease PerM
LGILGMIIALPMTTLLITYYQKYIVNREKIKNEECCAKANEE